MTTTPHDERCGVCGGILYDKEVVALRVENAQLRTMIVDALRAMKELELVLIEVLDKDRK